jgi:hypothetical protein
MSKEIIIWIFKRMMVVIVERIVSKMKPNSIKIMPIVSDSNKK